MAATVFIIMAIVCFIGAYNNAMSPRDISDLEAERHAYLEEFYDF